eukprot:scaffold36895_cov228-Skeletonema_dohrnii-CCMP3373.AAC.1
MRHRGKGEAQIIQQHGAKRKRWSNDGCTNSAEIRGACMGQRDMIESEDARNMDHHLKVKVTRRREIDEETKISR